MVVPQSLQRHRNSFDLLASQNCFESLADQTKIPDVSLIEFRLNDLALPIIMPRARLGGLEIDHQLEFGRLNDWQVSWRVVFKTLDDVTLLGGTTAASPAADERTMQKFVPTAEPVRRLLPGGRHSAF
jgi:hypothetical protein